MKRTNAIVTSRPLLETSPQHRNLIFEASEYCRIVKYIEVKMRSGSGIVQSEYHRISNLPIFRTLRVGEGRFYCHLARSV